MLTKCLRCLVIALFTLFAPMASAQSTAVYDSIPSPQPPNVPSHGFQCCQTSEFGDEVTLAGTQRQGAYATVLMSNWAIYANYTNYTGSGVSPAGFTHPITLSIYADASAAANHTPLVTFSDTFFVPWRPPDDLTNCPNDSAWYANGTCYHGLAFTISFKLGGFTLPNSFIYGIAYNTNTWGYDPIGVGGPYESLNVGLSSAPPSVGTDVNSDDVWISLGSPAGPFSPRAGWSPYTPAVKFTTYGFPTTTESCKKDAWKNLVRRDYTPFKNQGACVSYVNTGK